MIRYVLEFVKLIQKVGECAPIKRTSKSQQVFKVCSDSQAISGFGGRSCQDEKTQQYCESGNAVQRRGNKAVCICVSLLRFQ